MEPNVFIPTRARHDRYRLRHLSRQRKRRDEPPIELVSYAADDPARPSTLTYLGAALNIPWLAAAPDPALPALGATRWAFPFLQLDPDPGRFGTRPGQWDIPRNARNLAASIVPASAGRGAIDPRLAGYDLAARMWSVKRWQVSGSYGGMTIDESVAAGSALNVSISDDGETRNEIAIGNSAGARGFLPVEASIRYQTGSSGEPRSSVLVSFEVPLASRVSVGGGDQFWGTWPGPIHAGIAVGGELVILPPFEVVVSWDSRNADNEIIAGGRSTASLVPSLAGRARGEIPATLCGYRLAGLTENLVGEMPEPITIAAAEFWGPGEWPAG